MNPEDWEARKGRTIYAKFPELAVISCASKFAPARNKLEHLAETLPQCPATAIDYYELYGKFIDWLAVEAAHDKVLQLETAVGVVIDKR